MAHERYKPLYQEFNTSVKDNVGPTRETDRTEDKQKIEDKLTAMEKWLKSRNIRIGEIYLSDKEDLIIRITGGGTQNSAEIKKALQMVDLDGQFDMNRFTRYTVSQTDDYKYTIPKHREPIRADSNLFNGRDSSI